jgi:MFS family permease
MSDVQQVEARTLHGLVLICAAIMPAMAIVSLVPVLPLLQAEFANVPGSEVLVPVAMTLPALCVAIFSPFAGWLSDRIGRTMLLWVALFAYAGLGVLPIFLNELTHIIGARFGLGVSEAVIMTLATALLGDYFKGAVRERWIAIQIGVVSVSAVFLIAAGGALGEAFGSRGPFVLYVLAIPIALAVMLLLFEPVDKERVSGIEGNLPWRTLLPLLAITLGVGVLFYTVLVLLGDILALVSEVGPSEIGLVGAAVNAGVLVGSLIFIRLKRNQTFPRLLSLGMAILAVGFTGMALSQTFSATVLFAVLSSLGAGHLLPTMLAWVLSFLESPVRGRGVGLWNGMFFFGQFVAPLLGGALAAALSGLNYVLLTYGLLACVVFVMGLLLSREA